MVVHPLATKPAAILSLALVLLAALFAGSVPCAEPHLPPGASPPHTVDQYPCSVFPSDSSLSPQVANETVPVEVGMLFRAKSPGYATAIRFFKSSSNRGPHVGHLWSNTGEILASVTFRGESVSGWQEAHFDRPVPLQANKDYVISYFSSGGSYSYTPEYFVSEVRNSALIVPVDGGRFVYSPRPGLPVSTYQKSNYWVDLVFTANAPAEVPLSLTPLFPMPEQSGVAPWPRITAVFTRPMLPSAITSASMRLVDREGRPVPSNLEYRPSSRELVLRPRQALSFNAAYTVKISHGSAGPRDVSGNLLDKQISWSFTTGAKPRTQENASGPILVFTSASHPFSAYLSEILLAEGLNEFRMAEIDRLSPELLHTATIAILGEIPVTESQMKALGTWVRGGGKLIAMRPDRLYDSFYGIKHQPQTISNAYLQIDTSRSPGAGLTGETMQFHGIADVYSLDGATSVATLYSDAAHATSHPAISCFPQGKGTVSAFAFDLARSIVLTRQGNPDWSGMERDGVSPIRADDLFYSPSDSAAAPGWLDLAKVQIPQADELQRLFANLLLQLTFPDQPLPRFWYLPRGLKAVVVMTGDDHGKGNTVNRFENALAASAPNCSLETWECIRSSAYLFPASLTEQQSDKYAAAGFDIGVHVSTDCADWPLQGAKSEMAAIYNRQLNDFAKSYPHLPKPATSRTHCIAWGDYDTQPQVEYKFGIRLDTNYYYWPQQWVQDRPGLFTGSGMPMRFASRTGNLIDVYQAATFLTDESGQSYPLHINVLLDNALGARGYYGAFTANMHADLPESPQADAILNAALARNVPVISARQLLDWVDARNGSWFDDLIWSEGNLAFSVSSAAGAYGLQAMLPMRSSVGRLTALASESKPVAYTTRKMKGVEYCVFSAVTGKFRATYRP